MDLVTVKLRVKVQADICLAYRAQDSGEFFFVCCRRGLSELLGRRLHVGEDLLVEVSLTLEELASVTAEVTAE